MTISYAYLHTNGNLIFKRHAIDPSDFVAQIFVLDNTKRETFFEMICYCCYYYELKQFNELDTLKDLCKKFKFNGLDFPNYAAVADKQYNGKLPFTLWNGMKSYIKNILEVDFQEYVDWIEENYGQSYALFEMPMKNIETAYEYLPE